MAKRFSTDKVAIKARLVGAMTGAKFAQLKSFEMTTRMQLAQARAGKKFNVEVADFEELLAAVLAEMSKR